MARTKAFDQDKALAQAMRLFWRKGYAATSIEDLVEALQLSRSSLYDTFGDKRSLFLTVLRLYSAHVIKRIADALGQADSPLVAVQSVLDDLIASAETERGAMGCFMVNSVAELVPYDVEVTQIAEDYTRKMEQLLADAFRQAALNGLINRQHTPDELATYLFNTLQGLRILIKSGATNAQLRAIAQITMDALQ